jgi:hypothetical protein
MDKKNAVSLPVAEAINRGWEGDSDEAVFT